MPTQDKKTRKWIGRVRLSGYPVKFKRGFRTKKEAAEWEREQAEALKNPNPRCKSSRACLDYLKFCEKRWKFNTYQHKAFVFRNFLLHTNDSLFIDEVTPLHIEAYLDDRYEKAGGKATNRDLRELNTLFNWLLKRKYVTENPCANLERFHEEPFKKYVPPAEDIRAVLAVADTFEADLINTAYHTLARSGEIRNLQIQDCDFENNYLTLWTSKRKGGAKESDQIEMNVTVKKILQPRAVDSHIYVFEKDGKQLSKNTMDKILPRLCKKAGVKRFTFHSIRHHVAAILATRLPLIEVQKILRHKRATTTDIYLRSLVTVTTKGIRVLDDLTREASDNVIPFERAANNV